MTRSTVRCTALLLPALALGACRDEAGSPPVPAAIYVGRASCAACHQTQERDWLGSHHDLAMQEATEATVLGDFADASFRYGEVVSRFFRRGTGFAVETDGPDGALTEYVVRYVFGVEPLQQYLLELPGGRLQALSIAWDARPAGDGGQRWYHLHPDEVVDHRDPLHWTQRPYNWNTSCAVCHSTDLRTGHDPATDSYHTTWAELDVSCEACHGPGSRHVEWARGGARPGGGPGLAVRLAGAGQWQYRPDARIATRTDPIDRSEIETCAPCHSRRTELTDHVDPGRPFLDTHLPSLLDEGLYFADGQLQDEVYEWGSFVQSKMHHAGVSCSDCHDPHSLRLRAPDNALCAKCHQPSVYDQPDHHFHQPGTAGARCVECHMPERTYMGVDGRRDHSMRVPRPDLSLRLGTPNACTGCHTDRSDGWAAAAIAERRAGAVNLGPHFGEVLRAGRRGEPGAREALTALTVDETVPPIARATALVLLGTDGSGSEPGSLDACLTSPEPLVRLGAAAALSELPPTTIATAARLLDDPLLAVRCEAANAIAGAAERELDAEGRAALDAALAEYAAVQVRHADQPWSHYNLGVLAHRRGREPDAIALYRRALAVDPRFAPARNNLAELLGDVEGEPLLRAGLALAPDAAELRHALGLLLVRTDRHDAAIAELQRAVELRPEVARYSYVLAAGLNDRGDATAALEVLERAWKRHPWDRDLLGFLVELHRRAGDLDAAIAYARQLARVEPEARGLVEQIEKTR